MIPRPDQRELVEEFSAAFADQAAFRRWYESAVVPIYDYLYQRCAGDQALAEELTQQTFIQAIDRRNTFGGRSSVVTWLITIARNKLADHYRRLDREERRHLRLVLSEIHLGASTAMPTGVEDREALRSALRSLPALQRAAVVLRFLDGLSVKEVAEKLHRSESATESLLRRGRERLRLMLTGWDDA